MAVKIILRHDTAANWSSFNPTLVVGEIGLETDTKKFKIGDGATAWSSLGYATSSTAELSAAIAAAELYADSAISTHEADTSTHGVVGNIVGTSDAQTLTNKVLGSGSSLGANLDANSHKITGLLTPTASPDAANKEYVDDQVEPVHVGLITHALETSTHGVTGDIVGTSDLQTLTNKVMGDDLVMNGNQISGLSEPTQADHAATKAYADSVAQGLHVKEGVDAATTEPLATTIAGTVTYDNGTAGVGATLTLANALTVVDGITLANNDRILVKNEAEPAYNGIYIRTSSTVLTRDPMFDSDEEIEGGDFVFVVGGTLNGSTGWVQSSTVNVVGTDDMVWIQFSGAGTYLAGNGILLTDSTFSIDETITSTRLYAETVADTAEQNAKDQAYAWLLGHSVTSNVHGIDDTTVLATFTDVDTRVETHNSDTTNVHGIADTSLLATTSNLEDHRLDTTDVHGITDTANLVYQADLTTALNLKANLNAPTFTGAVSLPSGTSVVRENATTFILATEVDSKLAASLAETTYAPLNSPTFTTSAVLPLNTTIGSTTATEIGHLVGVSGNIQDQLDTKAPSLSPTFTGTVALPADTSIGLVSATEIGHLNGTTSGVQTQLDAKAPTASPTFTGTVSGITKTMVGLGNVDNTADVDKPVSTAQQTAFDGKADLTGDTFTGAVIISDTTASTSTTSGAVIVAGGLGVDGSINAGGVAYFGDPTTLNLSNPVGFFTKDVDDYIQLGIQNPNNGAFASSDVVLTADNGTNTTHYLDIGIASSGYNYPDFGFIQPNDGYILMEGGDLSLAASSGGAKIEFYIGGTLETDEVGSWTEAGLTVDQNLDVLGTITGNVTGNLTGDVLGDVVGTLTGDVTGNVSGNAGTVTNGVYTTDTGTVTNTMLAGSIADSKLSTISTSGKVANSATTATDANTADSIVARDASGNFSANMITLASAPTSNNHAATKSYVDNIAAGISFHEAVQYATTAALAATYSNGTSGVGATLTKTSNGAFTVDGSALTAGQRVLVKDQSTTYENGIYYVSTAGDGSNPAVLTRTADADNSPSGELAHGDFVFVEFGSTYAGYGFINTSVANPIVIGTDAVTYSEFSASQSILAGNGLTKTGSTVDIVTADTSRIVVSADSIDLATVSQSNSSGTAGLSFIQSHTVDSYGRITGAVTASVQDATTSSKGVASFASGTFSVTSGAVDVAAAGVTNDMLAGSIADSKLSTISTSGKVANSATTATELNTASAIVARDASGNFTAGIITAALSGNADTATNATNATNADNVGITEDVVTNGTKYLTWVDANSGDTPVKTTSTKLTFNPSTGKLSSTVLAGAIETTSAGITFNDGTVQISAGVPSITTISQKTDSYTLATLGERDTIVEISKASAATLTIPADATVDYPVGTTIDIIQTGAGQVTIAGAGGVTVNATPGLKLRTQWSSATLLKRAANTWLVYGDLTA